MVFSFLWKVEVFSKKIGHSFLATEAMEGQKQGEWKSQQVEEDRNQIHTLMFNLKSVHRLLLFFKRNR